MLEAIATLTVTRTDLSERMHALTTMRLRDAEFQVTSQFGDDGIIRYLTKVIEIPNRTFIEFGVGDYTEANTRFLLQSGGWRGLVLDCSDVDMSRLRSTDIYWKHDLFAKATFGFIRGMVARE